MNLIGPLVLFTKMMILAFVFFWVRFTGTGFRAAAAAIRLEGADPGVARQHRLTGIFKVAF